MDALSDVLAGRYDRVPLQDEADLRQLGYAATLVKGSVNDDLGRLKSLLALCRNTLADRPLPEVTPRDAVQRRWGARFHLDARKLKHELPLHLNRKLAAEQSSDLSCGR